MEDSEKQSLLKIFNSSMDQLVEITLDDSIPKYQAIYAEVIINFLERNIEKLEVLCQKMSTLSGIDSIVNEISQYRFKIAKRAVGEADTQKLLDVVEEYPLWKGDVYSVVACHWGMEKNYVKAKIYFKRAYNELNEIKCKRRALLAFQNYLVAETNIYPEKAMITEYKYLIKQAQKYDCPSVSGLALMNLSQQFQKMGSLSTALKEVNLGIKDLSKVSSNNIQYYLALSHKAHLLIEMNRENEAKLVIDEIKLSKHQQIREVLNFLNDLISKGQSAQQDVENLLPSWDYRLNLKARLGELEEKLLNFVAEGEKDKYEIIEHIYGDKIEMHILENRFKRLLMRLRKKVPGVIVYEDGKYKIPSDFKEDEFKDVS